MTDYISRKTAEDEHTLAELQAAGYEIYPGLVECLRRVDLRDFVKFPRFKRSHIHNTIEDVGYLQFVNEVLRLNPEFKGVMPRLFTQVGWTQLILDQYVKYLCKGLKKQMLLSKGFEQMYDEDAQDFWRQIELQHPDAETRGFPRNRNCKNYNFIYEIDAVGKLTVFTSHAIPEDEKDEPKPGDWDPMYQWNDEKKNWNVGEGCQLIVPWAGPGLRYARGLTITDLAEGVDTMDFSGEEEEPADVEMEM